MAANLPIIPINQRGAPLIAFANNYYKISKTEDDVQYLQCDNCTTGTAKRDIHTLVVQLGTAHTNCHVDMAKYARRHFANACADRFAASMTVSLGDAINASEVEFMQMHGGQIPHDVGMQTLKRKMYRARQDRFPPIPHDYASIPPPLGFPQQYAFITMSNNAQVQFMQVNQEVVVGQGEAPQRILAFATPRDLRALGRARHISVDGTFKVTPPPFAQLFTMNTLVGPDEDRCQLFPRIYFLLPGKSGPLYGIVLRLTVELIQRAEHYLGNDDVNLQWETFKADFEAGLLSALRSEEFDPDGELRVDGCHYHFCSAVYKHATTGPNSMLIEYADANDRRFCEFLKILFALPFLPEDRVQACFDEVVQFHVPPHLHGTVRMNALLNYYNNTWVNNAANRLACNCYLRTDRRTNNDLEGWHLKLLKCIEQPHKHLWSFLESLQRVHKQSMLDEAQVLVDAAATLRLRAPDVRAKEQALRDMKAMFQNGVYATDFEYVQAVARRMNEF